jgi:hypothetical protein
MASFVVAAKIILFNNIIGQQKKNQNWPVKI